MPGMVLFGRRWSLASDDLVFPGTFELFLRVLSWIASLTLYLMHRRELDCPGGALLSTYLIVLLVLLAVIICTVLAMVCVSMRDRGTGSDSLDLELQVVVKCATQVVVNCATQVVVNHATQVVVNHATQVVVNHTTQVVVNCATQVVVNRATQVVVNHATQVVVNRATQVVVNHATQVVVNHATQVVVNHATRVVVNRATRVVVNHSTQVVVNHATQVVVNHSTQVVVNRATQVVVNHATQRGRVRTREASQTRQVQGLLCPARLGRYRGCCAQPDSAGTGAAVPSQTRQVQGLLCPARLGRYRGCCAQPDSAGTICNPGPRKSMAKLLYVRLALFLPEMVWASLGAFWVAKGIQCDKTVVIGIITTVIVRPLCFPTQDTDLVPSDIAAGFTLLHQQQDNISSSLEPQEVVTHFPGQSQEADLDAEVENCHHFMPFAAAAYGWPLYIYRNPFTGLCRIGGDCCRSRETEYDAVEGDQHNCHFASILKTTGLQYRDFIHISFHDKVYELPFIVVLDHRKEAVVVAVRGTMSLQSPHMPPSPAVQLHRLTLLCPHSQDVLTDLSAESENIELEAELQDCVAHKGIAQAARYIYRRLVNDGILSQAFSVAPEYRLVLVGHSLGAGAAALLAIMLRKAYPQVRAYAFSPPRGLLSKSLYEHSKDFIVSLILGMDVIPRLSVTNMEDLKRRILRVIANCNKPKVSALSQG
ncbi:Sn1-specific diacylglycerol lipase beta [Microtus ochrogaster]|uniref:sn-1-specific diacylglycerol lipase n=1 Tax=Microtus ochrogaster TaxID=79684 RepID=A0A8J6KWD5_MICOH|nr:Sn1-specific diacylglycerol lipase beta [Microtus ochrogaster]